METRHIGLISHDANITQFLRRRQRKGKDSASEGEAIDGRWLGAPAFVVGEAFLLYCNELATTHSTHSQRPVHVKRNESKIEERHRGVTYRKRP
jgi:hypothetical protein